MKKKARQSSTAYGSASNAVDGVLASKTVSQCTATDANLDGNKTRWWSVDLQSLHAILYVNITSRADCCGQWTSFEKFQSGIISVARAVSFQKFQSWIACCEFSKFSIRELQRSTCCEFSTFSIRELQHSTCCEFSTFSVLELQHSAAPIRVTS